jgi:hypothetical protein
MMIFYLLGAIWGISLLIVTAIAVHAFRDQSPNNTATEDVNAPNDEAVADD